MGELQLDVFVWIALFIKDAGVGGLPGEDTKRR
jgi:hypothetical protein